MQHIDLAKRKNARVSCLFKLLLILKMMQHNAQWNVIMRGDHMHASAKYGKPKPNLTPVRPKCMMLQLH